MNLAVSEGAINPVVNIVKWGDPDIGGVFGLNVVSLKTGSPITSPKTVLVKPFGTKVQDKKKWHMHRGVGFH